MTQEEVYQKENPHLIEMKNLQEKYEGKIQYYFKHAMHMEDTESCMITLPCKNKGKYLMVLVAEI